MADGYVYTSILQLSDCTKPAEALRRAENA